MVGIDIHQRVDGWVFLLDDLEKVLKNLARQTVAADQVGVEGREI
tara:strand:+ start:612 stop:746 length:135 start_codon:yes stop_codon:yes gene_type:complete